MSTNTYIAKEQIPCIIYCGSEHCNCSARIFYEELEWQLTLEPKALAEKIAYDKYYAESPNTFLSEPPEAEAEK